MHPQGLEPWTHWLRVSCSTNWAKGAGSPNRARTCDIMINSHALYRLSYRGIPSIQWLNVEATKESLRLLCLCEVRHCLLPGVGLCKLRSPINGYGLCKLRFTVNGYGLCKLRSPVKRKKQRRRTFAKTDTGMQVLTENRTKEETKEVQGMKRSLRSCL